jgi:hypothetical protein
MKRAWVNVKLLIDALRQITVVAPWVSSSSTSPKRSKGYLAASSALQPMWITPIPGGESRI